MKTYLVVGVQTQALLILALFGGELSASRTRRFTQGERLPLPHGWGARWAPKTMQTTLRRENAWVFMDSNFES
jgi:hypothetical protein